MKQQRIVRKLELNKETVVHLEAAELNGVNGGTDTPSIDGPCVKTEPPVCDTDEFTCGFKCTRVLC